MTQIDLDTMTDSELRTYVLAHDKIHQLSMPMSIKCVTRPPVAIIEPEEWSEERMQQIQRRD